MAVVAIGASVTAAAQEDPTVEIGAVAVDQVRLSSPTASSSARQQQVEALERLDGTLTMLGDDPEDFYIGPIELEFGPEAWVMTAGPSEDFDGDGDLERLLNELRGLVGRPVTALVRLDNDGDEANVYRLNDLTFRDSAGGRPPWLAAEADDADAATWEAVRTAAADAVGPGAVVDELEWQSAGDVAWEVDVLSADGREHTVLLDSAAQVLDVRLGD
jgi:hypothetical protein